MPSHANINMTTEPELITATASHLVYLEKTGPFMESAPLAWQEFWAIAGGQFDPSQITGMVGLSRIDDAKTGDDAYIYQAGITLKSAPENLPTGLQARNLPASRYARFLLTGSYSQLPHAYPAAFSILAQSGLKFRDDFCMEKYLNTPMDTPESELQTEILIPTL